MPAAPRQSGPCECCTTSSTRRSVRAGVRVHLLPHKCHADADMPRLVAQHQALANMKVSPGRSRRGARIPARRVSWTHARRLLRRSGGRPPPLVGRRRVSGHGYKASIHDSSFVAYNPSVIGSRRAHRRAACIPPASRRRPEGLFVDADDRLYVTNLVDKLRRHQQLKVEVWSGADEWRHEAGDLSIRRRTGE